MCLDCMKICSQGTPAFCNCIHICNLHKTSVPWLLIIRQSRNTITVNNFCSSSINPIQKPNPLSLRQLRLLGQVIFTYPNKRKTLVSKHLDIRQSFWVWINCTWFHASTAAGIYDFRQLQLGSARRAQQTSSPCRPAVAVSVQKVLSTIRILHWNRFRKY